MIRRRPFTYSIYSTVGIFRQLNPAVAFCLRRCRLSLTAERRCRFLLNCGRLLPTSQILPSPFSIHHFSLIRTLNVQLPNPQLHTTHSCLSGWLCGARGLVRVRCQRQRDGGPRGGRVQGLCGPAGQPEEYHRQPWVVRHARAADLRCPAGVLAVGAPAPVRADDGAANADGWWRGPDEGQRSAEHRRHGRDRHAGGHPAEDAGRRGPQYPQVRRPAGSTTC